MFVVCYIVNNSKIISCFQIDHFRFSSDSSIPPYPGQDRKIGIKMITSVIKLDVPKFWPNVHTLKLKRIKKDLWYFKHTLWRKFDISWTFESDSRSSWIQCYESLGVKFNITRRNIIVRHIYSLDSNYEFTNFIIELWYSKRKFWKHEVITLNLEDLKHKKYFNFSYIFVFFQMAIAGAFGCFADIKPHKSKYVSLINVY